MSDTLTHVRTPERHRLTIGPTIAIWATVLATAIAVGAVMRPHDTPTPLRAAPTEAATNPPPHPRASTPQPRDTHRPEPTESGTDTPPAQPRPTTPALPSAPPSALAPPSAPTPTIEPAGATPATHPATPPAAPTTTTTLPEAIAPPPTVLEPTTTIEEPINARVNTPVPTIP